MLQKLLSLTCLAALAASAQMITTVNAADYSTEFAPGGLVAIFGTAFASEMSVAEGAPLPTELGGVSVEATQDSNTWMLPLYMVSETQINAQLPYGVTGSLSLRVVTESGMSDPDVIELMARAPKLFAWNESGFGRAVLTHQNGAVVTRQDPIIPGEWISIWANSLGETNPPATAGETPNDGSEGSPLQQVEDEINILIGGGEADSNFAGLAGSPGLYQINARSAYSDRVGDVEIAVGIGDAQSQTNISVPVKPNGFYWAVMSSKFPNGQTKTGQGGPDSAVAFYHEDAELWGDGAGSWSTDTGAGAPFAATSGLAVTLMNDSTAVYDNNGIEDGSAGNFYDTDAGITNWISMSGNYKIVHATHIRIESDILFNQIVSYFDGNGTEELPFDPMNYYNTYRMNIWSNNMEGLPAAAGFVGDLMSSDTTAGQFEVSATNVLRGGDDPVYRVTYTLEQPMMLAAGDYWFASDVSVPESPEEAAPAVSSLSSVRRALSARRAVPPGSMTQ